MTIQRNGYKRPPQRVSHVWQMTMPAAAEHDARTLHVVFKLALNKAEIKSFIKHVHQWSTKP